MTNNETVKLVAERSKELLIRQIETYRVNQNKSTTILGLLSMFLPLFVFVLEKANDILKCTSIIPIILMTYTTYLMLKVFRTNKLSQGYAPEKFAEFINKTTYDIYLYEISSNQFSFNENNKILDEQNSTYNKGIQFAVVSIILSIIILLSNIPLQTIKNYKNEHRKSEQQSRDNNPNANFKRNKCNNTTASSDTTSCDSI